MDRKRTYGESCAAAHSLDLVGERWALLVVRELLLGPKRFSDLRTSLPRASPRILTQRLRELEQVGVLRRRKLGPPVGGWVYELTPWGKQLESVLIALGRWGRQSPHLDPEAPVSVDGVMVALRSRFDPRANPGLTVTYALHFGDDRISVCVGDGRLTMVRGETVDPDAVIETDAKTFAALLTKRQQIGQALATGQLKVVGDVAAVDALFANVPAPTPAPEWSRRSYEAERW